MPEKLLASESIGSAKRRLKKQDKVKKISSRYSNLQKDIQEARAEYKQGKASDFEEFVLELG